MVYIGLIRKPHRSAMDMKMGLVVGHARRNVIQLTVRRKEKFSLSVLLYLAESRGLVMDCKLELRHLAHWNRDIQGRIGEDKFLHRIQERHDRPPFFCRNVYPNIQKLRVERNDGVCRQSRRSLPTNVMPVILPVGE